MPRISNICAHFANKASPLILPPVSRQEPMKLRPLVLLMASPIVVAESGIDAQRFFSHDPVTLDTLDGDYRTIAACAYQHLAPRKSGLSRTDYPEQGGVRISSNTLT